MSSGSEISVFESAYKLLIGTANRTINAINTNPIHLALFCQTLSEALENKNSRIHIAGVGPSGEIAQIFGECLKNIGFSSRVFYQCDSLAQSVGKDDVILAVTDTGWTKFTNVVIEEGISKKGKILVFTGNSESKAAKLSNAFLQSPIGFQPQDNSYLFTRQTPLSPLGTIFDLTTMVIGIGVINGVFGGSCTRDFNEGSTILLEGAKKTLEDLKKNSNLKIFMKSLSDYCQTQTKVFIFGRGINRFISRIFVNRFQSLGMNVHLLNDWRFRQRGDLLITLSGSGASSTTLKIVETAKASQMTVLSITSFLQSKLSKESDEVLVLQGRKEMFNPDKLQLEHPCIYFPIFEYTTSITLEACVAQIAADLGKSEDSV